MREITVNGKPLSKCLEELQVYKKPDDYLQNNKYPYYKIESYYERINSIFSMANYNVTYPVITGIDTISSGQQFLTVKCHLEILNDDGMVVLIREGLSSKEITHNDAGKEVNLKNLYRSTSQLAFKAAWDHLNIFDSYGEHNESNGNKSNSASNKDFERKPISSTQNTSPSNTTRNSTSNTDNISYEVFTLSPVQIEREERGKSVYFVLGELKDKTKVKVIFYPNQYGKNENAMLSLIEKCENRSVTYRFKGSSTGTREGLLQIVFKGL